MTPSLGLINLLQLTELRETFYLLDVRFIIKEKTQEQSGGREAQGKVCGKEHRALMFSPGMPPSLISIPAFSKWEALQSQHFGISM